MCAAALCRKWCVGDHVHACNSCARCNDVHTSQAAEEEARANKEKEAELMTGNPLLGLAADVNFAMKRRWVMLALCERVWAGGLLPCGACGTLYCCVLQLCV